MSRRAHENYGFDKVLDNKDLGRSNGWTETDVELIQDFVGFLGPDPAEPFFAYVLLVENHRPHKCGVSNEKQSLVRFSDTEDSEPNCALQEYLRIFESTTAAVNATESYLLELQRKSHQPFVLLVYGDHQPFSFTGTHMVKYDFDPFRREVGKNVTFFHILTSISDRLGCCLEFVPASLLPTLISAFVATDPQDIYLGLNPWLYKHCGHDALGSDPITWLMRPE